MNKYFIETETGIICGCAKHYVDAVTELINQFYDFMDMRNSNGGFIKVAITTLSGKVIREVTPGFCTKQQAYDNLMSAVRRAKA